MMTRVDSNYNLEICIKEAKVFVNGSMGLVIARHDPIEMYDNFLTRFLNIRRIINVYASIVFDYNITMNYDHL
jgi:hypothetical protein